MQFIGDYHTHSHLSDGRQSAEEIIEAARNQGLKEIAITDHGPLVAGIGVRQAGDYLQLKEKLRIRPDVDENLRVLVGAEANIRDMHGTLDIASELSEELDILIAGLHPYTLPTSLQDGVDVFVQNSLRHLSGRQRAKAKTHNTKATVEAIYQNPGLDILSHPGLFFAVDVGEVALACVKNDVLFEINCGHEHPAISDIMEADKVGVDFIVNSDAHFRASVGQLEYGQQVVEKLGIAGERLVNRHNGGGYAQWGKKVRFYTYS